MTIPTISEIKGNTILQLLTNAYNTLKNAIMKKQNKLVAGSNIIINEETNTISAVEGGTVVLDDYYTKTETDDLLDEKANAVNTYDKEEVDDLLADKADIADVYDKTEVDDIVDGLNTSISAKADSSDVYTKSEIDGFIENDAICIDATISDETDGSNVTRLIINTSLIDGDIIVCKFATGSSSGYNLVMTYSDNIECMKSITAISREGTSSFYINTINFRIRKYNEEIRIEGVSNRLNYSEVNGTSTVTETQSWLRPYAQYSSIKIYRRKV